MVSCWMRGDVARVLDGDGGVVGENVQEGDGVVGQLVGAGIEDLDGAVGAFASAQGQRDDRAHLRHVGRARLAEPRIVLGLGNDERLAVLDHPAGYAFADLHAQVAERRFSRRRRRWRSRAPAWSSSSISSVHSSASMNRSMCSRMVRRIVSRSKLEVSERANW